MSYQTRIFPGSFQPDWITSCTGWYRADTGISFSGPNVTGALDLSPAGNNLAASGGTTWTVASQAGANNQLGFVCDGSGCLQSAHALNTGTDPQVTYFLVSQTNITGSYFFGFFNGDPGTGGEGYIINDGGTSVRSWYNSVAGPSVFSGNLSTGFEISCFQKTGSGGGTAISLNINTVPFTTTRSGATTTIVNDNFGLGGWNAASLAWQGVICEFISFNTALSNKQISEVMLYLGSRYNTQIDTYWIYPFNINTSGQNLSKSSPDGWDASAYSVDSLSGNGYCQFTTAETNTHKMCGLCEAQSSTNTSYTDINYGIYLVNDGTIIIYESGVYTAGAGTYVAGDIFRVQMTGGTITYLKNGTVIYTSLVGAINPLYIKADLYSPGSTINNAFLHT